MKVNNNLLILYSYIIALTLIGLQCQVQGQSNKVSPKLDFDDEDTAHKDNSSASGTARSGGSIGNSGVGNGPSSFNRNNDDSDANRHSGNSGGRTGPKIHGVRVTVDTGDEQKSKESKESVEIPDSGKHKKRVGIHTDITFEITADGEVLDGNATNSAQRNEKEDASVPIFKGRGVNPTHKSRRPNWNPSFSGERRSYGGGSNYYPQYPNNVPAYRSDGWTSYVPMWTTERSHSEPYPYRPNSVTGYRAMPSWKPCYCVSSSTDNRRRRENHDQTKKMDSVRPTSAVIQIVDGKLERGFSNS